MTSRRDVATSNDGNFSQNHVDVHNNSTTYDNKKIQEIEPQTSTAPLLNRQFPAKMAMFEA